MELFDAATAVRANAHVPYSGFRVGAAIRDEQGRIFAGCNVENVAYPQGTCAEAGAIAAMVAAGGKAIAEVLVVADAELPVPPCGGCRQKLAEFAAPGVTVTLANLDGPQIMTTLGELLPGSFTRAHMSRAST